MARYRRAKHRLLSPHGYAANQWAGAGGGWCYFQRCHIHGATIQPGQRDVAVNHPNPPFMSPSGGIKPHNKFRIPASRAEVLFADFILEHLSANGRAGFIVPEGIIFQNNEDYVSLRQWLINEAGLWAVVSLPAQIFQPYSGVKTSVLLIDRALARQRQDVLLVKVENDGFSLNTNRTPIPQNDLPAALELLKAGKQPDFQAAIAKLNSPVAHRKVPRADFAKLDAYKASSSAYDACRKFFTRGERLKKTAVESRASGDEAEAVKAEKALERVREVFAKDTGLGELPATEAGLKARFDEQLKAAAVAYGDLQPAAVLTAVLKQHLDNQREFNLSFDRSSPEIARDDIYEKVKLGDDRYFKVFSGGTPKTETSSYWNGDIPWATLVDLPADDFITKLYKTKRNITREGLQNSNAVLLPPKSILVSSRATIGRIAIAETGVATNQGFKNIVVQDFDKVDPGYVAFILTRLVPRMIEMASGATFKEISKSNFEGLEIPLPPLEEQRAIVAEVESCQRVVDGCAAVLDHYRPSFIASPDWPTFALHEIAEIDPKRPKLDLPGTAPVSFLPMSDLSARQGEVIPKQERPLETVIKGYTYFAERDVIVAKITPCFENGKMGVIGKLKNGIGFGSTEYYVIRANADVLPEFLFASLCHPQFIAQGEANMSGSAGQQRVTKSFIHNYQIAVPDLDTQRKLVAELQREQASLAGLAELRAKYAAKIAARLAAVWGEPK